MKGIKNVKLKGWQRIGIIASGVWILGAGVYTYDSQMDRSMAWITSRHVACDDGLRSLPRDAWEAGFSKCNKIADDSLALAVSNARLDAALVALVPVSLAWGFTYLVLFLVHWVKRGFTRAS